MSYKSIDHVTQVLAVSDEPDLHGRAREDECKFPMTNEGHACMRVGESEIDL